MPPPRLRIALPSPALLFPGRLPLRPRSIPPPSAPTAGPPPPIRRHGSLLGALANVPASYKKRIRRGRGPASGKGKTAGRGTKGQKARGKPPRAFNGGQTPLEVTQPPRGKGFKLRNAPDLVPVPLSRIQSWIAQGRLSAAYPITPRELHASGCARPLRDGVKLLATSHAHDRALDAQPALSYPVHVVCSRASAAAIAAVEAAGGSVTTRYYTPFALRKIVRGEMHPVLSLRSREVVEGRVAPPGCGPATGEIFRLAVARAASLLPEAGADLARARTPGAAARAAAVDTTATAVDSTATSVDATAAAKASPTGPVAEAVARTAVPAPPQVEAAVTAATITTAATTTAEATATAAATLPLPPHVSPARRPFRYRLPDPTRRADLEYYRDPRHRGYLAYTVRPGETPSLFFRRPVKVDPRRAAAAREKAEREQAERLF